MHLLFDLCTHRRNRPQIFPTPPSPPRVQRAFLGLHRAATPQKTTHTGTVHQETLPHTLGQTTPIFTTKACIPAQ